jgi:hypothetical protein
MKKILLSLILAVMGPAAGAISTLYAPARQQRDMAEFSF